MALQSLAFRFKSDVAESQRVADLLQREAERVGLKTSTEVDASSDLVVAIGGDGTVLNAIREMGPLRERIPILAIHTGTGRGFLHPQAAPKDPARLEEWGRELAEALASGRYRMTERWGLEGRLSNQSGEALWSLNDFVVSKGLLSRLVVLRIDVVDIHGETLFSKMRGDGLIVASSLGSTAYSFSAGGPVVHPRLKNLVLTPICPVDHPGRSFILSGEARVVVSILPHRGSAHLTLDGQIGIEMPENASIEMGISRRPVRWIKPILTTQANRGYFEQLRTKLGFGGGLGAT